jgi:hypothetical protein
MTYYTVPEISTTFYEVSVISILKTWKDLKDLPAMTWAKLKELQLTSWKKLSFARYVTLFYPIDKPTTTFYEVT